MASIQQAEMGLSFTRPCLKATHNLPTPPSSPRIPPKALKRQASRFRLPKILRRAQTVDPNPADADRKILHTTFSSLEHREYAKQERLNTAPCRPIHAIEQALPLFLPVAQMCTSKDESLTRTTSRKLRKMPKSHGDLKAYKYDMQPSSQPPKLPVKSPTLLPSPLPSDGEGSQDHNCYVAFRNPKELRHTQVIPAETSYEYEGIVAGYCEDVFQETSRCSEGTSAVRSYQKRSPATPPRKQEITHTSAVERTPPTSNMSATLRSPKRDRSSSLSSEALWLSKSFAVQDPAACVGQLERIKMNEKRLAEKSRRCCHLVQGPSDDLPASWIGERKAVG